jgi:CBS-domain-containing membrane protein
MHLSRVADLMHPCASATIQSETSLRDAAKRILTTGLEALPVVNADGAFTGLVAQSALIRELMCTHCQSAVVRTIVSHHVDSARNTATLDSVLPLFRSASVTIVPVVDENDHPVGLVHREDVIRYLLDDSTTESRTGCAREPTSRPHFLDERRRISDQANSEE